MYHFELTIGYLLKHIRVVSLLNTLNISLTLNTTVHPNAKF